MIQRIGGLLKTKAWYSNDEKLLKDIALEFNVFLKIKAVPPPFRPPLVENKKLKFGGQASVRTTGASVPSHVSDKRIPSNLFSKITSFIIKVLFKRERTFSTAKWMFVPNVRSSTQGSEPDAVVLRGELIIDCL